MYYFLGHVFLRECQKLLSENVTRPATDIYWAVRNAIFVKMGVDGTDLSHELEQKKKDIMLSLAPYNILHKTIGRTKRTFIPPDLLTMDDFDSNHQWNFVGSENICKYAGNFIYLW